jgi:hypothetical protein
MTTDRDMTVPDDGPSVSIVDTICGSVVRTRNVVGFVAAVWLRRVAVRRHPEGTVLLDLRATGIAEPGFVAAVADLAAGLQARGDVLRVVRSPQTPQALVEAAGAPVYDSLAEAFGCRSCAADSHSMDLPARIQPAPIPMPDPRRPESD